MSKLPSGRLALLLGFSLIALAACKPAADPQEGAGGTAATLAALPEGVTLVEEYSGGEGDFSIPYAKYRLRNGLTVILHEDHSDPMAHVDISYHVGSSREQPGHSGFAHFFEHMMFEGSAHVAEGDHGKIITNAGGTLNGTTNSDRTNYYQTIPVNQLEVALWLEADRMGFLLDAINLQKFELQRETVKNERGQRVDNVPYGRASETMMRSLYPADHPYSWPVIGWMEDLETASLEEVERFFLRWYGPNNAQLVIGGDIDRLQTLEWIAKYFGPIPAGPAAEPLEKAPARLEADRYVTLEDNIHLPAIAMLFPTVSYFHPDEAPLDAAAEILGGGKASLLYQNLVQSGRAVSAHVSHACRELACEMAFIVVQNPAAGETLAEMEAGIRATLTEFVERGVNDDDLQKFKAQFESGQIFGMQSVAGKVGALAFSQMFHGDPKAVQADLARYSAVTADAVRQAFSTYIEDQPAVVLSIVPAEQAGLAARQANFVPPANTVAAAVGTATETPTTALPLRPVEDGFDRSVQPEPGVNPAVQLPPVEDRLLANGARLLAVSNHETPTVTLRVVFDMGQRDEPAGKAGLAALTAAMLSEATQQRSAAEFSEALERIGATLSVDSGHYESGITLNTLARNLDAAMALLLERMLQPAFAEADFTRIQSRTLEGLRQAQKSGPALAGRALGVALAGPTHPLSYPPSGLPSTVAGITLEDVKSFHATHVPARLKGILVSTSLPMNAVLAAITPLGALSRVTAERPPVDPLRDISGREVYFVDKPGATQSSVRIVRPALRYDALGDFFRAGLMNFALGGTFDSRINLQLREARGWTYGAYTSFSGGKEFGSFQFSGEIDSAATREAILATLQELESYARDGMTEQEYAFMLSSISQRDALRYETPGDKLGLLGQVLSHDLPLDFRRQQQELLNSTPREQLNGLAARLIDTGNVAIIVAGDAASVRPQLEDLGLAVVTLDGEGFVAAE